MIRELHNSEIIYWRNYMIKQLDKKELYCKMIIYLEDFMISKLYDKWTIWYENYIKKRLHNSIVYYTLGYYILYYRIIEGLCTKETI